MSPKSIIIIGAGIGGLSAGIYGQMNGYRTQIFEMHSLPGGQCTSWQRQGYTFDACIHHLLGCSPQTRLNALWRELGAMPTELVYPRECVAACAPDGKLFRDYYDPDLLENHLKELSPADARVIDDYVAGIRFYAPTDLWGRLMVGTLADRLGALPTVLGSWRWVRSTMKQFAERFSDPFLRRAFPLLEYSFPDMPFILHLQKHGLGAIGDIAWPIGGSLAFARSIERRYVELGGEVHYRHRVEKILTENDRAVGVRLADGSEHRADIVISNADGRKTILDMLDGRYVNSRIRRYCAPPPDETNWAVHVFLGVNRDLSGEPSALVMLLEQPVTIAGRTIHSLEMQMYGFDPTMAPPGKGVIKVELVSSYSYWQALHADRSRYNEEKARVAETVIQVLETRFPGIKSQVEAVDVPTLLSWERYMGGTHGFNNAPAKKQNLILALFSAGLNMELPGLQNFYFVGIWATSTGTLFANALSGKKVIQAICRRDGKRK